MKPPSNMKRVVPYKSFQRKLQDLATIKDIQSQDGDDAYNVGLYNGLELASTILNDHDPKYKEISEDKILHFAEFEPTKYNGNVILHAIMEWLQAKRLEQASETIELPLTQFLSECKLDRNKFLTFVQENKKTRKALNFDLDLQGDIVRFSNFRNEEPVEENKE